MAKSKTTTSPTSSTDTEQDGIGTKPIAEPVVVSSEEPEPFKFRSGWCGLTVIRGERVSNQEWEHKKCVGCVCPCHSGEEPWGKIVPPDKGRRNKLFVPSRTFSSDLLPAVPGTEEDA